MLDLISVIITAYRAEDHIHRSVKSILQQTHQNFEIILVSDDLVDYRKILQLQNISDARIKFISTGKFGSGQANAINLGIENSSANYISNLDFDDEYMPKRLEILLPLVKKYGAAASDIQLVEDKSYKLIDKCSILFSKESMSYPQAVMSLIHAFNGIIFDKRIIKFKFPEYKFLITDKIVLLYIFNYIDQIGFSNIELYKYYRREGSLCNLQDSVNNFIREYSKVLESVEDGRILDIKKENLKQQFKNYLKAMLIIEEKFSDKLKIDNNAKFSDSLKENMHVLSSYLLD